MEKGKTERRIAVVNMIYNTCAGVNSSRNTREKPQKNVFLNFIEKYVKEQS